MIEHLDDDDNSTNKDGDSMEDKLSNKLANKKGQLKRPSLIYNICYESGCSRNSREKVNLCFS